MESSIKGISVNEIKVNGVDYVRKDSVKAADYTGDVKIVVLQRGWVLVGIYSRNGEECQLNKANVIRKWGTTNGLGEIAKNGPTSSTKLDPCNGTVKFHNLTVVLTIECNQEKWQNL